MIQFHKGKHKYRTIKGEFEVEIFNQANYHPTLSDNEDVTDIFITFAGNSKSYPFHNILKILSLQIEIEEEKKS